MALNFVHTICLKKSPKKSLHMYMALDKIAKEM
jgi:hypothetical protein